MVSVTLRRDGIDYAPVIDSALRERLREYDILLEHCGYRLYARFPAEHESVAIEILGPLMADAERLNYSLDVFTMTFSRNDAAWEIFAALQGIGKPSCLIDVALHEATLILETHGSPLLAFDIVDVELDRLNANRITRAAFPLDDATATAVLTEVWNLDEFSPDRLLENAARAAVK